MPLSTSTAAPALVGRNFRLNCGGLYVDFLTPYSKKLRHSMMGDMLTGLKTVLTDPQGPGTRQVAFQVWMSNFGILGMGHLGRVNRPAVGKRRASLM